MPYRINGIGTTHIAKQNRQVRSGQCPQCLKFAVLSSYDTYHFFTILFLPIIPLGKKRVMDHCPKCEKFFVSSWSKWNQSREEIKTRLRDALTREVPDPAAAIALLGEIVGLQDKATFDAYADQISAVMGANPNVLYALADGHFYFGDLDPAQQCAARAFELDPSKENRELLGLVSMGRGHFADARAAFQHLLDDHNLDKILYLTQLVVAYQADGQHAEALTLITEIQSAFPKIADDKDLVRLRKLSAKHQHTGKPVAPKHTQKTRKTSPLLKYGIPVFIVVLLGSYIFQSINLGRNYPVYFVNGLPVAYTVEIDGRSIALRPKSTIRIPLGDGEYNAHVQEESLAIPDTPFTVNTSFFSRSFDNDVFVLNPDRIEIIAWENTPFADLNDAQAKAQASQRYKYTVYVGRPFYSFSDIDYPFEPIPDEIDMSEYADIEMRSSLTVVSDSDLDANLSYIEENFGGVFVQRYLTQYIAAVPDDETIPSIAEYYLGPGGIVQLLEPYLDRRTDDVDFHRAYQNAAKVVYEEVELLGRYGRYARQHSDDSSWTYLLARVMVDPDRASKLLTNALETFGPDEWISRSIGYSLFANAEFEELLKRSNKWSEQWPDNEIFPVYRNESNAALKKYKSTIDEFEMRYRAADGRLTFASADDQLIYLYSDHGKVMTAYCLSGDVAGSDALLKRFEAIDDPDLAASGVVEYQVAFLAYRRDYVLSNGQDLPAIAEHHDSSTCRWEVSLINGDLDRADELATEVALEDWQIQLLQGISAKMHGQNSRAEKYYATATAALDQLSYEYAPYAAALRGNTSDHDLLRRMSLEPYSKLIALTALAHQHEAERTEYAKLANKLNYQITAPYYFLRSALAPTP